MMLFFGTALVSTVGAVLLARRHADRKDIPQLGQLTNKPIQLRSIIRKAPQSTIVVGAVAYFPELERALQTFDSIMVARAKSGYEPISEKVRDGLQKAMKVIISGMTTVRTSSVINEENVNTLVKMHNRMVAASLVSKTDIFLSGTVEDTLAALNRVHKVEQGRMDMEYIKLLCSMMNFSLQEVLKNTVTPSRKASHDELRAMRKEWDKYTDLLEKRAAQRLKL